MKRITAAILLSVLFMSLAACGGNGETTAVATSEAVATEVEETISTREPSGVPESLSFNGETFRSIRYGGSYGNFYSEGEDGDVLNDAVYRRRRKLEETLDISWTFALTSSDTEEVVRVITACVLAGEDAYDQVFLHSISGNADLTASGYLYNYDDLPYISMDADWWSARQTEQFRFGKNTYLAINDLTIPTVNVIYFNRDMVVNMGLDDPYKMTYGGTWVLDKYADMVRSVNADLDGDGTMNWKTDRYGMTVNEDSKFINFLAGCDQFITGKNMDGRIELALNTPKTQKIIETFADLKVLNTIYQPASQNAEDQLYIDTGRVLFYLMNQGLMSQMRDYEVEFGLVPFPKYDEKQEEYLTLARTGAMCIPVTIGNPELVGACVELLAYLSTEEVIPTYYDVTLTEKMVRDTDTRMMLELCFDTACLEVGGNYFGFTNGFRQLYYIISELAVKKGSSDFASFYASYETAAQTCIDNYYAQLDEVESRG